MPTKTPPTRADLQKQINQLDLDRLLEVRAIFARPEVAQMKADLEALRDPTDTTALHRSAVADPDALIANALVPLENTPGMLDALIGSLEQQINPTPAEPEASPPPRPPAQ